MVYKSTEDVVQRVMPLLELLAERTIDKARLLQYLSARAGIEWGALDLIEEREGDGQHPSERPLTLLVSDRSAGETSEIEYPACLPRELDRLVQAEYKRLATAEPLSTMAAPLFIALFHENYCSRCQWRGALHAQVQRECHFAGRPVNFDPVCSD